jgi:hypothetical protein
LACLPQPVGRGKTIFNLLRPEKQSLETGFHLQFTVYHSPFTIFQAGGVFVAFRLQQLLV